MKVIQRIPTSQYAYIEFEGEYDSPEDAIADNARLVASYDNQGMSQNEWAKVCNSFYATGEINPELTEQMNNAQRFWVNQTKLAQRAIQAEDPIIN